MFHTIGVGILEVVFLIPVPRATPGDSDKSAIPLEDIGSRHGNAKELCKVGNVLTYQLQQPEERAILAAVVAVGTFGHGLLILNTLGVELTQAVADIPIEVASEILQIARCFT